MSNTPVSGFWVAQKNSEYVANKARELWALFLFNSAPMVARNKVRALSTISTMQTALEELKQYIEGLED